MSSTDELVMYLIVRKDLKKMGMGKVAAQCGHAVQELVMKAQKPLLRQYRLHGMAKIVLKTEDLESLLNLRDLAIQRKIPQFLVVDAGRTQIAPDTPTVLGLGPVWKGYALSVVADLKLL